MRAWGRGEHHRTSEQRTRASEHFAHEKTGLSDGNWWRSSRERVVDPFGLRRSELATSRRVAPCALELDPGDAAEAEAEAEVAGGCMAVVDDALALWT